MIGITAFLRGSDMPADLPGVSELYGGDEDWMSRGNSTIVASGGAIIAGPLIGEAGTVSATLDLTRCGSADVRPHRPLRPA